MKLKKIRAVLFDYDGVLAQTMEDNFNAWRQAFQQYAQVSITRDDYLPLEGSSPSKIVETIGEKYKIESGLYGNIVVLKERIYQLSHSFALYPGVDKVVSYLKEKKILVALVSGASRERLYKTTPSYILDEFDCIITADDVKNSKPHKEPYKKTLKQLKVKPEESIVIENAPLGIKSAKAAGIYCLAICSTLPRRYLLEADEVVRGFSDLELKLKSLLV